MLSSHIIPSGQRWLMQIMKKMGYPLKDEKGVCFGISHMGMQAELAGEITVFNNRLQTIYDCYMSGALPSDQKQMLDLREFFDGVMMYQNGNCPDEVLDAKEEATYTQGTLKSIAFVAPLKLLSGEGEITRVDTFSGCYSRDDMLIYFREMENALKDTKGVTSFIMNSLNHSICVNYIPSLKSFRLTDANQLPAKIMSIEQLGDRLVAAFSSNNVGIFSTHAYAKHHDAAHAKQVLAVWRAKESVRSIQCVTKDKAKQSDSDGATWLLQAAQENYLSLLEALLIQGADSNYNEEKYYEKTPYEASVLKENIPAMTLMLRYGADMKASSLTMLLMSHKINAVDFLIRQGLTSLADIEETARELLSETDARRIGDAIHLRQCIVALEAEEAKASGLEKNMLGRVKNKLLSVSTVTEALEVWRNYKKFELLVHGIREEVKNSDGSDKSVKAMQSSLEHAIQHAYKSCADGKLPPEDMNIQLSNEVQKIGREHVTHCCSFFSVAHKGQALALTIADLRTESSRSLLNRSNP